MRFGRLKLDRRAAAWVTLIFVGVWMWLIAVGRKLPYLELDSTAAWRSAVMFALLYGACLHFLYLKPVQSTGRSAIRTQFDSAGGGTKGFTQVVASNLGALLICSSLALTSFAPLAFFTELAAAKPAVGRYTIQSVESWGGGSGSKMRRLKARDVEGRKVTVNLRSVDYKGQNWDEGIHVCMVGRRWALGTTVDSVSSNLIGCGHSPPSVAEDHGQRGGHPVHVNL